MHASVNQNYFKVLNSNDAQKRNSKTVVLRIYVPEADEVDPSRMEGFLLTPLDAVLVRLEVAVVPSVSRTKTMQRMRYVTFTHTLGS